MRYEALRSRVSQDSVTIDVEEGATRWQTLEKARFDGAHAVLRRWPCHLES
jgi:hypothetical protein